jgi:hypothetical protein
MVRAVNAVDDAATWREELVHGHQCDLQISRLLKDGVRKDQIERSRKKSSWALPISVPERHVTFSGQLAYHHCLFHFPIFANVAPDESAPSLRKPIFTHPVKKLPLGPSKMPHPPLI